MATLSILLQSVSLCEDKNDMLLTPSCQAWNCPFVFIIEHYTMTGFCIFSPIYDRVIVKYRVRDESRIYFFGKSFGLMWT